MILEILLAGLSQPQYYEWTIITNVLDAVVVGFAIGIASLIIRITIMHRENTKNIESNTYKLVSAIGSLTDSFQDTLTYKNIKINGQHMIIVAKKRLDDNNLYTHLPKNLIENIHKHVIYLLMKPIYASLTSYVFFARTHKIDWKEFKKMSSQNYYLIFKKFPNARKKYIKSHHSFSICYNMYRELKGDN